MRRRRWGLNSQLIRVALLALLALPVSYCGQNFNSDSNDGGGDIGIDCSSLPRLCAAYQAMMDNHCFECHAWRSYKTDAAWVGAGLVVSDSPQTSMIIQQLQNSGGSMPQNYTPLSNDDYNALVAWIQNM